MQQRDDDQAIITSTSQAARVWEPKNRDPRPSLARVVAQPDHRERDDPAQHPDGEQVLQEAEPAQCPMPGIANVRENRSP